MQQRNTLKKWWNKKKISGNRTFNEYFASITKKNNPKKDAETSFESQEILRTIKKIGNKTSFEVFVEHGDANVIKTYQQA